MATKTISPSEDAYERLGAMKRGGESFSGVVRRLTRGVRLSEFHGVLSAETAAGLEAGIEAARSDGNERRRERLLTGLHHAEFDRPAATWAGETSAALTREGQRAEVEDVTIGAVARQRDESVLTRNVDDFERLPGVAVERY